MNTFANLESYLTDKLSTLLAKYLTIFSSKVILLLQLGTPILVFYYGYSIMTPRGSSASIYDMLFNLVRIGIIFAFVENSAGLLDLTIGFIHELKTGFIGEQSVFTLLDEQHFAAQQLGEKIYHLDTSYIKLRGLLASSMVWLGTILIFASSSIVFIATEVSLTLLTVTAPIFVGCLTYSFTRELFNGWLRSVFSCIITLIFASLIMKVGIDINKQAVAAIAVSPAEHNILNTGAMALSLGIVVSALVLVATKTANNIAGVAASAAIQGRLILGTKAGMKTGGNTAASTAKAAKNIGNKIGRSIMTKLNRNNSASKDSSETLEQESQKAALARVQQTNSQDQ